jgi:hypothetical protein
MAKVLYPYMTLEEKQGIIDANTDKTLLGQKMYGNDRFLVYDDGVEPPFTIPDKVIRDAFIVMLGYVNEAGQQPSSWVDKTPAELLADVKARQ